MTTIKVAGAEKGECVYKRTKDGFTVSIYKFKDNFYKANCKYVYKTGNASFGAKLTKTYKEAAKYLNEEIRWHLIYEEKIKYLDKHEKLFDKFKNKLPLEIPFVVEEE